MATVTGLTAERMQEIEAAAIVDGDVIAGNLVLTRHDGSQINAGSVVGPVGPQGPVGSDLDVLIAKQVLNVGLENQIRAGRQLGPADFANIGLSAPLGLWNLSNLTDASGNGRNLLNKGSVPFAAGINGVANTAAQFTGSAAQALYIADTGASDPFRIKSGSFGCWFRNAKRGLIQVLMSKWKETGQNGWLLTVAANGSVIMYVSTNGSDGYTVNGVSDVFDDCWHFAVATFDGTTLCMYIDGVLENRALLSSAVIFPSTAALNIGGRGADAAVATVEPWYGRIDEAFVTSDILTEDQVYNLYCAKIPHTLGETPSRVTLNIRRRRKGPALIAADFPTQPVRLYNFSAGSLSNEGSQGAPGNLVNTGAAVSVAGVDGTPNNAFSFNGVNYLASTDTGLPAGTTPVSFGCWFKTTNIGTDNYILTWGATNGINDLRLYLSGGALLAGFGGSGLSPGTPARNHVADGQWHFVVLVFDNTALDGVKSKLYIDGRLVSTSATMGSTVLGGANKFVIGANLSLTQPYIGQIDGVFVSNVALTFEDILKLYTKGTQALAPSPKNAGDHIEAMSSTDLLTAFDTLDSVSQVDLKVIA